MEDASSDADLFTLLQEIEHADAPLDALDTSEVELADVFRDFPAAIALDETTTNSTEVNKTSHVERCRLNRKRKKQELEDLRADAATLEATLTNLLAPPPNDASSVWQAASRRSLRQCHQAIAENKKLRDALQQQWDAAQVLQHAMDTVPKIDDVVQIEDIDGRSLKRLRDVPSPSSTRDWYHELFAKIHSAYQQNERESEIATLKIGVRKISMDMVSEGGGTDMSLCVRECQRLPFSLSYVRDATWKHLSSGSHSSDNDNVCGQTALSRVGDDLFGDCGSDCNPLAATTLLPPGRLAIRRYVEPHRLTFVWECDGCFHCDDAKTPLGRVTERGWCTVEPSDDRDTSTVFRIQVQYVPHSEDENKRDSKCCSSRPVLSSDMALSLYRATIARTFGAVEQEVFKDTTTCKATSKCRTNRHD